MHLSDKIPGVHLLEDYPPVGSTAADFTIHSHF